MTDVSLNGHAGGPEPPPGDRASKEDHVNGRLDWEPGRAAERLRQQLASPETVPEVLNGSPEAVGIDDAGDSAEPETAPSAPAKDAAAAPARPQRGQPGEPRDIIPPHLRTWQGIRKAVRWHRKRAQHSVLYHAVRSPKRLVLTIWWALVGVARIVFAQLGWWWVSEQAYLRHEAAAANDPQKWLSLHKHVREVRLVRGCILGAEVLGLVLAAGAVTSYAPLAWLPVGLAAVPALAWIGRPADKPIMTSAVVPAAVERLTTETIVRALGALGIGEMNKSLREDPEVS